VKKQINVVGAVLTDGSQVLAAQRGPDMSLTGMWEFPGGKIEEGETPKEALFRELEEELNCAATIGDEVTTTEYEYDFGIVVLTTFFATLEDRKIELTEHAEARWVDVENLDQLDWAPADIPAVQRVMSVLG